MHQLELNRQRAWLILLLALLAMSSLGFALLGLVLGPELTLQLEQQRKGGPQEIVRPLVPDVEALTDFWREAGYFPVQQTQSYELQGGKELWLQGSESWVLVPSQPQLQLTPHVLTLCGMFLAEGWLIQIEAIADGYSLGFWSRLPATGEKVLAFLWNLRTLTPVNYPKFNADLIEVMGEVFDPNAFLRGTPEAPLFALVIDDWGYPAPAMEPLLAFPFPLTVAVLPHLVFSWDVSERAAAAGHQVILHQPMEALNSNLDLGPGGITVGMDPDDLVRAIKENLASLSVVAGVNNHMGSKATEDPATMAQVLAVIKELGLFFVDSRTSTASVVALVASEMEVAYGANNLFIDNEADVEKIKSQIRAGLLLAQKQGHATAIGHVRPATAIALWEMVPEFLASNVRLVPVSELLLQAKE